LDTRWPDLHFSRVYLSPFPPHLFFFTPLIPRARPDHWHTGRARFFYRPNHTTLPSSPGLLRPLSPPFPLLFEDKPAPFLPPPCPCGILGLPYGARFLLESGETCMFSPSSSAGGDLPTLLGDPSFSMKSFDQRISLPLSRITTVTGGVLRVPRCRKVVAFLCPHSMNGTILFPSVNAFERDQSSVHADFFFTIEDL